MKLLVGVLEQMRGKLKLDYERLATHMGSGTLNPSINPYLHQS